MEDNEGQTHSTATLVYFPPVLGLSFVSYLGQGAYGKVYLVQDKNKHLRAVKTYDLRKMPQNYREKFIPREVDLLLKISHPNIIRTQKICKNGNFVYMVMEYAGHKDLEHYIHKGCTGIIQESRARSWTRQIANALEYLHTIGIVHRDLKCENILVSGSLNAKLADFGFTRLMRSQRELSATFCGTATYAAPEVILNIAYNPRFADIWSLGVVLFRILNKSYPFGNAQVRVHERHRRQKAQEYKFNRKFDLSVEVKQLISNMLEPNPRIRITAKDIQRHPWIQKDKNCSTTEAEEEALKLAKGKPQFFQTENPIVRNITSLDSRVSIVEESAEKTWPNNGAFVTDGELTNKICQNVA